MTITDTLVHSGHWLFRRRSYLPLALFVPVLAELWTTPGAAERAREPVWAGACLAVNLLGLTVRLLAVGHAPQGTSGRNTQGQIAEVLNTTGLYSLVRHPLYVGNALMWLGPALLPGSWMLAALVLTMIVLFYERVAAAEEAFLGERFGREFATWVTRTPAVWPFPLSRWRPPALPFSWRSAARREYSGLYGSVVSFAVLEVVAGYVVTGRVGLSREWSAIVVAGTVTYLVLRTLKRRTRVLHVEGR